MSTSTPRPRCSTLWATSNGRARVNGVDVRRAAAKSASYLRSIAGDDWSTNVAPTEWDVTHTVGHMMLGTLWYAIDLAATGTQLDTIEMRTVSASTPADLV